MGKRNSLSILIVLFVLPLITLSQKTDSVSTYKYTLKELSELNIITGSVKEEKISNAPSNITIITNQMIEERGYQTLIDVCQDIPGFDFMMFNDGSGEYSTYNMNRGIGEIGNPEIIIMIDGIIQNNISFNWSLLWTYENMFIDVERIEIIKGPGSVMYGAQAFTGVIHIITKKNFEGSKVKAFYGSNFTHGTGIYWGTRIKDINISIALHKYHSDGDQGIGRYDPGGYFNNNKYPEIILADYNNDGNYVLNTPNPLGGENIPDGFNNENDSFSLRGKISSNNSEIGFFYSKFDRGYSSANAPYEYNLTAKESRTHYESYHIYYKHTTDISSTFNITSNIVFRASHILPKSGFKYLYRFPNLTKSYAAYAYQGYIEEKLLFNFDEKNIFYLGLKATLNRKSERIVSLGNYSDSHSSTNSSWDIAVEGNGLNQIKNYQKLNIKEAAIFLLWDTKWHKNFSSSLGIRYDHSSEYGNVFNPRIALIYKHKSLFGAKFMFGTAFREPGIFELTSEFRGNPDLLPEKIKTSEVELNSLLLNDKISVRTNVFYSRINQFIGKVADPNMPAGERYENLDKIDISGISVYLSAQLNPDVLFYSNYSFLTGINIDNGKFYEIERTAKHKINAGINLKFLKNRLITDFRLNFVGKRKAQANNTWLQTYENGYAPSYTKANLVVSYKFAQHFTAQFLIDNLFNEQYYGIGRESGSGFIDSYDYQNNIDPDGHIPAYHPQPGRTILFTLTFQLNETKKKT